MEELVDCSLSPAPLLINSQASPPPPPPPPFVNSTPTLSWPTRALFLLLLPVAAARCAALVLLLCLAAALSSMALAGLPQAIRDASTPLPTAWRRALAAALRPIMRGVLACLGLLPWHGLRVHGAEHRAPSKAAAAAVVSNHVSFFEPLALYALQDLLPVTAAENTRYALLGPIFTAQRAVPVSRGDAGSRRAAARKMAAAMADAAAPPVLVFPEGTASNGSAVLEFKRGAFASLLPVQPVAVRYERGCLGLDPCWVAGGPSQYALLARALFGCSVLHVTYLPPMAPSEDERARSDSPAFAARVAAAIAASLGVPASTYAEQDQTVLLRALAAHGYRAPLLANMLPRGGIATLGVRASRRDELRAAADAFAALDASRSGVLRDGTTFADHLRSALCRP